MSIKNLSTESWIDTYLVSNTPEQLFTGLRSNPSIMALIQANTLDELANEYERITTLESKSLRDLATAYAIIVAITFLNLPLAKSFFAKINLQQLDWGIVIRDYFYSTAKSTNISYLDAPPQQVKIIPSSSGNNQTSIKAPPIKEYIELKIIQSSATFTEYQFPQVT